MTDFNQLECNITQIFQCAIPKIKTFRIPKKFVDKKFDDRTIYRQETVLSIICLQGYLTIGQFIGKNICRRIFFSIISEKKCSKGLSIEPLTILTNTV